MDRNFAERHPSWDLIRRTLAGGGLGSWRAELGADGKVLLTFDDAFFDLTGLARPEMPGTLDGYLETFIPPDQARQVQGLLTEALSGIRADFSCEHSLLTPSGRRLWVKAFGQVEARDEAGRPTGFFGFLQDITGNRRNIDELIASKTEMEAQMLEKNQLLHQIQKQVADIVEVSGHPTDRPGLDLKSEVTLATAEGTGLFTDYLNQAFAFISDQMAWYKAILDSLPFPVGVFDLQGHWAYLNSPSRTVHGGHPVKAYLGQPNQPELDNFFDYDISGGEPAGETTTFTRYQTGVGRLFHGQNSILRDEAGRDIGRIEILRDVTEIREADERTRIMLDALPLACNFWDENFRNLDCNQAAATLFDLPDKEAYLDHFFELSPEFQPGGRPSAELAQEYVSRAFHDGSHTFEWMHQKLDGTPVPCEISLVRVARRNGFIVAGYTRDLREIKRTRAERDMERKLLRKIMDSAPIFFAITVEGVIKFITPFAHNFSAHQVGDHIDGLFENADQWLELKRELAEKKYVNWRPVEVKRADGRSRSMLLNSFTTDYYGEIGEMSWLMDITELKERALELKEARDAAEESTRAKSEFLANMSHEIRTPMNAILGLIHLVLQTEITEVQREYLQKTEGSAKTLLRIINDILDFSKIEAGKLEMEQAEFHLADVLQQVADQVSTRAHEKGLEFLLKVPADTPAGLIGDQVRLAQVLTNLASNAVKFTEKGQVTLKVETVSESPNQATLRFLMEDTGIGLSQEQIANLFAAFSQAEASTTRRFGGTGLGLAISKRLVEMMGGEIWCQSQLGCGSTFGFTANFGLHGLKKRYVVRRKDFSGLSALVVDDNVVGLEILSDFLKTLGFSVATATSGQEALNLLTEWKNQGRHFDLVFIDWKMPDMDGIETSNRIHDLIAPTQLPVIIMATAYNRDDALGLARKSGIRNVMTKPLSPSTLLNVLVDIFGRGLPEKESKLKNAHEMAVVKELAGSRILLAEDNEVNQLVASRILKNAGLVVEIANNGLEAVEMVKTKPYDLVLMDIQMPEMDGITATREIRGLAEFQDLPIVAMTAHAMSGDRELSLSAGMNDHINKPINLQELFSTLAKWLRKKPGSYK